MPKWLINQSTLTDIANAIRTKKGTSGTITVSEMADEIASISGGGGEELPVTVTYTFSNNFAGNGAGSITLSTTDSSANGNYKLYWANDNGIMENHSAINTMQLALTAGTPVTYDKFASVQLIPKYATKVVACKEGSYTVLGKFDIPSAKLFASGNYGTHDYTFGVLADIHLSTNPNERPLDYATFETSGTDFASALLWFNNRENVNRTGIAGDITCTSIKSQCDTYKTIRDICSNATPVNFALGNHDVAYTQYLKSNVETYNNGDGKYFSKTVGDDVFAFVSVYANSKSADLFPLEELIWLEDLLELNRNKRVFVFTHVPPHWESCGGFSNPNGIYAYDIWGKGSSIRQDRKYIEQIMARYKNSIWFFGHTHMAYYMQERNTNCNYYRWNTTGARMFHVSSCSVPRDDSLNNQRTELEGKSEGYAVDVYPNTILVRGREFADNFYVGIAQYIVDTTIENISARTDYIVPRETAKVLSSITAVLNNPTVQQNTTYVPNATVTAHYDDSSSAIVTSGVSYSSIDTSTTGEKTLTISYTENEVTKTTTATVTVTAEPVPVTKVSISAVKTKVSYNVSETFSTDDVVVTMHYSDSSTSVVPHSDSDLSIGTVDTSTAGNKTLLIRYDDDGNTLETTIAITVVASGGETITVGGYTLNLVDLPSSIDMSNAVHVHIGAKMNSSSPYAVTENQASYALSDAFKVSNGDVVTVSNKTDGWQARWVVVDSSGNVLSYSPSGSTEISASTTEKSHTITDGNAYALILRMYGTGFSANGSTTYTDNATVTKA